MSLSCYLTFMSFEITKDMLFGKHILAIDYGQKITGLATFKVGNDPFPLCAGRIIYKNDLKLIKDLEHIVQDNFIDFIVVGIPYFTDGGESSMTKTIKRFTDSLRDSTSCKVFTVDETLTTFEAEERMKNDPRYNFKVDLKKIDELSAVIILEIFLKNSSN